MTRQAKEVAKIQVIMKISADVARTLQRPGAPSGHAQELLAIAKELGVVLEPMHPGVDDPGLAQFFVAQVPDSRTADRVIARIRQAEPIEAAYLKSPDEAPAEENAKNSMT